jgi:hypothetical protein
LLGNVIAGTPPWRQDRSDQPEKGHDDAKNPQHPPAFFKGDQTDREKAHDVEGEKQHPERPLKP